MEQKLFSEEFDLETYIEQRFHEMKVFEDKLLYKKIVGDLIQELFAYTQQEYEALEQRVLSEYETQQSKYAIYLGLTDQEHYDPTDTFLCTMIEKDVKEKKQENIEAEKPYIFDKVFLEANINIVEKFAKETFIGTLKTEKQTYPISVLVKKDEIYLDMIQELYHIFGANYLSWTTVCCAYLNKIFELSFLAPSNIGKKETVLEVQVDWKEFSSYLRYQPVPLWNITKVIEKTSTFPEPCLDKTNYEHYIYSNKLQENCQYLVTNTEVEITNIRRVEGDLILTCPEASTKEWILYQVNPKPSKHIKYLYPILTNQIKESFAGNVNQRYGKTVKTKSEIARILNSFDYSDYIIFKDVRVLNKRPTKVITYSMDAFIQDEIRLGGFQQTLEVCFQRVGKHYLQEDIMSFLVTQVQKLFPEYDCIGVFVGEK